MPNQRVAQGACRHAYKLLHVHRLAEIAQQLLGTTAAGLIFVDVARLASYQFLVVVGHGAPADPLVAFMDVDVIEFGHGSKVAFAP